MGGIEGQTNECAADSAQSKTEQRAAFRIGGGLRRNIACCTDLNIFCGHGEGDNVAIDLQISGRGGQGPAAKHLACGKGVLIHGQGQGHGAASGNFGFVAGVRLAVHLRDRAIGHAQGVAGAGEQFQIAVCATGRTGCERFKAHAVPIKRFCTFHGVAAKREGNVITFCKLDRHIDRPVLAINDDVSVRNRGFLADRDAAKTLHIEFDTAADLHTTVIAAIVHRLHVDRVCLIVIEYGGRFYPAAVDLHNIGCTQGIVALRGSLDRGVGNGHSAVAYNGVILSLGGNAAAGQGHFALRIQCRSTLVFHVAVGDAKGASGTEGIATGTGGLQLAAVDSDIAIGPDGGKVPGTVGGDIRIFDLQIAGRPDSIAIGGSGFKGTAADLDA